MITENFKITTSDLNWLNTIMKSFCNEFKEPFEELEKYDKLIIYTKNNVFEFSGINCINITVDLITIDAKYSKMVLNHQKIFGYEMI